MSGATDITADHTDSLAASSSSSAAAALGDGASAAEAGPSTYPHASSSHHYSPSIASSSSSVTNGKAPAVRIPSNLRFQRRQSERAYLEGSYRDGTPTSATSTYSNLSGGGMDYTNAAGGGSPWANSPDASRTSFGDGGQAGGSGVPRQDLPGPAIGDGHEGGEDGWTQEQRQQWQYQQQQQHHPGGQQERGSGEENRRPHSSRYHRQQQQHQQQQHHPQYKLQAKITSLERSGKKDPILRFDVYVCEIYSLMSVSHIALTEIAHRPTSRSSGPRNFAASLVRIRSLPSSQHISLPQIQNASFLPSLPPPLLRDWARMKMKSVRKLLCSGG
jgi:hypothetical protein